MFQYALGKRLSSHHRVPLKLDISGFERTPPGDTPRSYALEPLAISADLATPEDISRASGAGMHGIRRRWARLLEAGLPYYRRPVIHERGLTFDARILRAPPRTYLFGWWASEKYFKDIATTIRSEFSVRSPLSGANAAMAAVILDGNAVSVHVRRGDYVTNPRTHSAHGLCAPEYYRRAIGALATKISDLRAFVFSDDIEWAKQNLQLKAPVTYVDHNGPDQAHEDLRLMSLCRHHVIANSTFSWWGAWLSAHPGKAVIAPAKWSNDPAVDTRDLLPPQWQLC
jgi:hypothetical protein